MSYTGKKILVFYNKFSGTQATSTIVIELTTFFVKLLLFCLKFVENSAIKFNFIPIRGLNPGHPTEGKYLARHATSNLR